MRPRIPQPPVNPLLRAIEHHDFWLGLTVAVTGLALVYIGVKHLTGIDTVGGGTAWEPQLIKAFASGGLQYKDKALPPDPSTITDPVAAAEAMDRLARLGSGPRKPQWKITVDTGAKTPCPT